MLLALTGITWQQRARLRRLSGAHSPGSSQTLAALLGRGPSADERAWRARINAKLQAAVAKLEDASFSDAAALFGEVLDEEPIEPRALQGRREALVRLGQNEGLSGGKHALQAAHPFEALVAASSALVRGSLPVRAADGAPSDTDPDGDAPRDDGDGNGDPDGGKKVVEQPSRVPAPGAGNVAVVAPAPLLLHDLQTLAEQGAGKVAQICGERAQAACLGEDFVNCLQQTACLQAFDPNDELAAALLALAAEVVANPASPRSPQPLQAIYPEPRMRRAMLTYATGGYAVANKQLHVLVGAKSLALQADITQLGELTDQASKAAAAGDLQTALGLYQEAASIDKRLVPQGVASAPRQSLTRAAQAIFLRIGQTQQEQGKFAEAVSTWQRGLSLHAASLPLQRALLQLHLRAEKLMAQAKAAEAAGPSKGDKGRDLCQPLKEALEMTGEDDPLHESIKTKLAACSRKKSKSGKKPSKSAD